MTPRTLLSLARERAETHSNKAAFDYCRYVPGGEEHSQITFGELDARAKAIAAVLQQSGVEGERVLVLCPSGLDFIVAFFGCVYAGAVPVPVHPPARERVLGRVASIVSDTQARFVVSTAESRAQFEGVMSELTDGPALQWCAVDALTASAEDWVAPHVDVDAPALLQYTSGSTSVPKGVVVTNRSLLHNLEAIRTAWGAGHDRAVGVFWLPLHHDMGLIGGVLASIYVGATSYFMLPEAFVERPMRWVEAVSKYGGTITAAPNFAYQLCIDLSTPEERAALDLSTWSTAMCGAEPVRAATMAQFIEAFAPAGFLPESFSPVYGLAEATLLVSGRADRTESPVRYLDGAALREHRVVTVAPDHSAAAPFVACGRAQHDHQTVIVDPVTRRACAPDEVGEIWLAGGSVAAGYWGKPAETQETFNAVLADSGQGPFLRTGDLGFHLDGELFISGRLKDLIVIRGRNHYPEDIETTMQDSHAALLRGRGAGFSVTLDTSPDEQLVVVHEIDRNRIADIHPDEIIAAIRTSITEHHQVRPYAVVLTEPSSIPTTSSGKIRRERCKQRFLAGELDVVAQWQAAAPGEPTDRDGSEEPGPRPSAQEITAWLVTQLARQLDLSPAEIDTSLPFAHYGLDSVHAIRLSTALAERLGREFPPTLAYEHPSIDALSSYLAGDGEPEAQAAAPETEPGAVDADEPIAIIGIGCRFPGADGPAAFWRLLSDGGDAVTDVPAQRWTPEPGTAHRGGFLDQVDQFDAEFFSISPREAKRMDPQQRLLLEVAWEALEDAGQVAQHLAGSRTGVFVGVSTYDYGSLQYGRPELIDAYTGTGGALSIAANRLSYALDLRGPSLAVDTACSSSLVAIHQACRSLRDGESTLALAGGVNVILSPALGVNFSKATLMAADGRCKTFDAAADGYVRGEGAGIVILKPMSRALADGDQIYAVLRGSAVNHDGRTNGLTAPSRQAQEAVLADAYRRAGVSPGSVQYVEAHGTGTALGDTIEANALGTVLAEGRTPDNACLIGSVKTNIGHLEAAAGVAGLIKVALALHHREIPASLHCDQPNPNIPFDRLALRVAQTAAPWPQSGRRAVAGVSSFGFGGTNAHVVMTEAPEVRAANPTTTGRAELLALSARSPEALSALANRYELALASGASLTDLCYTAGARRDHLDHRLAAVGRDATEISESLAAYRRGEPQPGLSVGRRVPAPRPGVVFVFSGQGSQWRRMGQQLHAEDEVFRDAFTACDHAMQPYLGRSVIAELLADDGDYRLVDISTIQPAIFAVQVALAALWQSWGVEPAAVIGHSMGEVAAAHVAGALSLDEAAQVICARARLLKRAHSGGAMLTAELTLDEAHELIAGQESHVVVAASNSYRSTVLSGDSAVLAEVMAAVQRRDRFCRWVEVDVASHSPRMDALRADLTDALAGLRPAAPTTPMYSTVTGEPVGDAALDAAYWADNLCSPVRFSPAARQLLEQGHDTYLEISPHPVLLSALREDSDDLGVACTLLSSSRRDDGGRDAMLTSLGSLYSRGQSVAWNGLHPGGGHLVAAPTYPWQRERFWLDPVTEDSAPVPATVAVPSSWRGPIRSSAQPNTVFCDVDVSTALMPALTDHRVQGSVVVPAAGLLELVSAGAERAFGSPRRAPHDVVFHRSLVLTDSEQRTVQLVFRGEPSGPIAFECQGLEASGSWSLLANGVLVTDRPDTAAATSDHPDAIQTRCPETIPGDSFYSRLAQHGLEYGPAFQKVADVWRRDGEAIARLAPPDPKRGNGIDATILDGCFQVLAATLPARNGHSHDTYLPVGVSSVHIRDGVSASEGVWCHALLGEGSDTEPNTVDGDVFLLNGSGTVITAVRGLRLKRIPGAAPTPTRPDLYLPRWHPAELAHRDPRAAGPGRWLIFGNAGTTTRTLRQLLEQRSQTCVVVESGAEYVQLGPDSYRINPAEPQHFRRLMTDIERPGAPWRGAVHLWSLDAAPTAATTADSLESARVLGPTSVLHLVQALTTAQEFESARLWLVTRHAQPVDDDADAVSIAQAPLWGMGRSIDHEHPELRCSRIDLPLGDQPDDLAQLADELIADAADTDVAFRGNRRYAAGLARFAATDESAAAIAHPLPEADTPFRLHYPRPGVLDDIETRTLSRRPPAPGEVEIQVRATGLNFIDVMRALGVYPGQDSDVPVQVGIECAGTVTAVGAGVEEVRVGDAVIAVAADGIGSCVTTPASLVAMKPVHLSFEQAATIPIAFLTAYYALREQARLRRGERILIHSAAGGVGLAAIEVARWLNATVIATAGTAEKRDYLRGLGIDHVFDSRSTAFADEVVRATNGDGVDVVLNSLTGEAIAKSLDTLRPFGRFLEIGKTDIYGEGRLHMWQLRNNTSFIVVDLAQLIADRPDYVGALLRDIVAHLEHDAFRPLPVRTFPVAETAVALRTLGQGKQIGKVAVSTQGTRQPEVDRGPGPARFHPDATYLVTGGLGGIGRAVASWLVDRGAKHLLLLGRGPISKSGQQAIDALRSSGCDPVYLRCDVTKTDQLAAALDSISATMPPLRGVVHAAGILDDGILARLDDGRLRDVMAPKVAGAWNLHTLTSEAALDFFVLFSSAAALLGSPGQAHYAAGNAFCDALAWHRRAQGRPALSINWGPWDQVGLASGPEQQRHLTSHGITPIPVSDGLHTLATLIGLQTTQVAVLRLDPARLREQTRRGPNPSLIADLLGPAGGGLSIGAVAQPHGSHRETLLAADGPQRLQLLETYLRDQAAGKLGRAPSQLDVEMPLHQLGVDSLIAVELRAQIERDLGVLVPVVRLLDSPSVTGLAEWLAEQLSDTAVPDSAVPQDTAAAGAAGPDDPEPQWLDALGRLPEISEDDVDSLLRELLASREGHDDG